MHGEGVSGIYIAFALVPSLEGFAASSDGFVWSRWQQRTVSGGRGHIRTFIELGTRWRRLKGTPDTLGYRMVRAQGRLVKVHRLVLEAFVGPAPDDQPHCRHLDNDATNNRIENLCWGSAKENAADRTVHGTERRGETSGRAKLTDQAVIEIRQLAGTLGPTAIARRYGVTPKNITAVLRGKTWRHIQPDHQRSQEATCDR